MTCFGSGSQIKQILAPMLEGCSARVHSLNHKSLFRSWLKLYSIIKNKLGSQSLRSVPSVQRSRRRCVRELQDGIGNSAPGHCAIMMAFGHELVGTRGALLEPSRLSA